MASLDIPSPISETSESSVSQRSSSRPPRPSTASAALNFSRPRPQSCSSTQTVQGVRNHAGAKVHTISAFHDSVPAVKLPEDYASPEEPRFSTDSAQTTSAASAASVGSDLEWDEETGEMRSRSSHPIPRLNDQRYVPRPLNPRPANPRRTAPINNTADAMLPPSSRPLEEPSQPPPSISSASSSSSTSATRPYIIKQVSFDQQSSRLSTSTRDTSIVEDARSHHTVTEDGDADSIDSNATWQSSDFDYRAVLGEKKIKALQKKGINPALYAEMKAAKRGRGKWSGSLIGNSYLG